MALQLVGQLGVFQALLYVLWKSRNAAVYLDFSSVIDALCFNKLIWCDKLDGMRYLLFPKYYYNFSEHIQIVSFGTVRIIFFRLSVSLL